MHYMRHNRFHQYLLNLTIPGPHLDLVALPQLLNSPIAASVVLQCTAPDVEWPCRICRGLFDKHEVVHS